MITTEECQKEVLMLIQKYGWMQVENCLYLEDAWELYLKEYNVRIDAGKIELERLIGATHN